ncbi:MAG: hypothetical protein RJA49_143 [Actinomycetota bacterium]
MATEFTMPKLGLTMEEATIIEWLVADGGAVVAGTSVMRIETDKVETEVEISAAGVLHQIGKPGDVFPCGAVVAFVLSPGEAPPAAAAPAAPAPSVAAAPTLLPAPAAPLVASSPSSEPGGLASVRRAGGRLLASPNARRVAADRGIDLSTVAGTGPGGRIVSADVPLTAPVGIGAFRSASGGGSNVVASIAARNLADLLGIDLAVVPIDPVEHRVTRDGVAAHVRQRLAGPAQTTTSSSVAVQAGTPTTAQPPSQPPAGAQTTTADAALLQTPTRMIRMSGMRGTIAKRMQASLRDMAQLTLYMDADLDAVVADRTRRNAAGAAPGFTDYVVAAAARALVQHPDVNSQITSDGIAVLPDVHVGLAVALDNGLLVPVVRHADRLPLDELALETTRLAAGARAGKLGPIDFEGATFSVSALGMFGVDGFTPVINPPNAAILGVGRLRDDVVVIDGTISTVKRLTLSLTWDHRVLDGAPAAAFCRTVAELLADPAQLA